MGLSLADAERILAGLAKLDTIIDLLVTLGGHMATAKQQLDDLKAQLADTSADVLAKLETLEAERENLSAEAQTALDEVKAGLQQLDTAVGDADGSDTPTEPTEPEPTA